MDVMFVFLSLKWVLTTFFSKKRHIYIFFFMCVYVYNVYIYVYIYNYISHISHNKNHTWMSLKGPKLFLLLWFLFLPDSWQAVLRVGCFTLGHFLPTVCHVIPFDYDLWPCHQQEDKMKTSIYLGSICVEFVSTSGSFFPCWECYFVGFLSDQNSSSRHDLVTWTHL